MADQQIPGTQSSAPALSAPPALQLVGTDSEAGLCVDGYCVLPGAVRPGSEATRPAE